MVRWERWYLPGAGRSPSSAPRSPHTSSPSASPEYTRRITSSRCLCHHIRFIPFFHFYLSFIHSPVYISPLVLGNHCSQTPCIKSLSSNHYRLTDLSFSKLQKWVALFLRSCTSTPTTVLGGGRSSSSSGSRIGSRSAGKGE